MLQCPHCAHRTFETGIHIAARVRITALDTGDYREEEIDSYDRDWTQLTCARCERYVEEDDTREAFEIATLYDGTPDDIYDWFDSQRPSALDPGTAAHEESLLSIAGAWSFWRWQEEREYRVDYPGLTKGL